MKICVILHVIKLSVLVSLWSLWGQAVASPQPVVLISLDGFRHDYIELHQASALAALAKQGVRAQRLIPVYPANTFPNHLSIITGLAPARHGIVNNSFLDKSRPEKGEQSYQRYAMGKAAADSSWVEGLPLWNLVEFHGFKAATYFWPESDALINGNRPSYHYHYSKYADYQGRIDQIMQWLALPAATRPLFVAGYFSLVDSKGHEHGPLAQETRAAVQVVDQLMGQLMQRLQTLPYEVNLVVVSDHGMMEIPPDAGISVTSLAVKDDFAVINQGSLLHLYAKPETSVNIINEQKAALRTLASSDGRYQVLNEQELLSRDYVRPSRVGDILLETKAPFRFVGKPGQTPSPGGHGFDPSHPDMGGIFLATGPAFKQDVTLSPASSLEVYPLLAKIMDLPLISPVDATPEHLQEGLVNAQ